MIKRHIKYLIAIFLIGLTMPLVKAANTVADSAPVCETDFVKLDIKFPTGNIKSCQASEKKQIDIIIAPEDAPPINCSAWYAFRLTPAKRTSVKIKLSYEACGHRYLPKISTNGFDWQYMPLRDVKIKKENDKKYA